MRGKSGLMVHIAPRRMRGKHSQRACTAGRLQPPACTAPRRQHRAALLAVQKPSTNGRRACWQAAERECCRSGRSGGGAVSRRPPRRHGGQREPAGRQERLLRPGRARPRPGAAGRQGEGARRGRARRRGGASALNPVGFFIAIASSPRFSPYNSFGASPRGESRRGRL